MLVPTLLEFTSSDDRLQKARLIKNRNENVSSQTEIRMSATQPPARMR